MKEGRREGGITAGPESKVLEGPTFEEAMPGGHLVANDGVDFKVGAASKGIIQRDYQHHATVYKSAYAKNPFDNVSSDELAEYKRIIEAKGRRDECKGFHFSLVTTFTSVSKTRIFWNNIYVIDIFSDGDDVHDASTLENTTGEVTTSPPIDVLSPTSPTTDTEHTTGISY